MSSTVGLHSYGLAIRGCDKWRLGPN